jgi:hypothetical protein
MKVCEIVVSSQNSVILKAENYHKIGKSSNELNIKEKSKFLKILESEFLT